MHIHYNSAYMRLCYILEWTAFTRIINLLCLFIKLDYISIIFPFPDLVLTILLSIGPTGGNCSLHMNVISKTQQIISIPLINNVSFSTLYKHNIFKNILP